MINFFGKKKVSTIFLNGRVAGELAYSATADGSGYEVINKGNYIGTRLVIPQSYRGKPVVSIGYEAFHLFKDLISVVIPSSVTNIGEAAFSGCENLNNVSISKGVKTIDRFAFNGCGKLTYVIIPDGVETIGWGAFGSCYRLTIVGIPKSVKTIKYGFNDCIALTAVMYGGTMAEWEAIEKHSWDENTGNYTIHCTDGKITKS
jgi:hypothetical protein